MMNNNPYQIYQQTQVKTLSQGRSILMLYEGAIRFATQAKMAMEQKNFEKACDYLSRTEDIIEELDLTLNMEAGQVAENLRQIYRSLNHWLLQANMDFDSDMIDRVCRMLQELYAAWREILKVPQTNFMDGGSISA